ncbi:MAG: hypothetical protein M3R17_03280 [Bacteroidota bacterium]|nr:hypothetical protein [Bacteroidota bacterium]
MSASEDIADLFSMFHDGGIEEMIADENGHNLKIGLTYLAERIKPEYHFFYLRLISVEKFEFVPWTDIPLIMTDHQ